MMAKHRYTSLAGILSSMIEKRFPRWLKEEMLLVPVREAWQRLPHALRAGCAPVAMRGRTLIVGVDGAPRMTEMSFHRAKIIRLLASMGFVFEDIKFRPVSPNRLPSSSVSSNPQPVQSPTLRQNDRTAAQPPDTGLEELTRRLMSKVRQSSSTVHGNGGTAQSGTKGREYHD